jgi:phosphomannomutase
MTATEEIDRTDEDAGMWPPDSARPRWDKLREKVSAEGVVTLLVVVASVVITFTALQPSQLFKNTTPAGGDMGAHVWLPAYVKRALLPHLRLTGWAPDWYSGFPALTYYFPLPIVAIALVSYVIPYNIAFKLITVLGLVTLPVAAWALGRLARMRFPMPAILAAATLPFIFSREFTIYGGNIASTMAGEFSFSISLSLALLFLGLFARGMQDGKHRASAAVVLAGCGLSHILPLFFALAGAVVMLAMNLVVTRDLRRLRWAVPAVVTGGLLIAFWALPFYFRLPYATNMGYEKITNYWASLSHKDTLLIGLALAGFVLACIRVNWIGIWLGLMAGFSVLVFVLAPPARLWNARVLPFWFLCLYLLVGVLIFEGGTLAVELARPRLPTAKPNYLAVPLLAMLGFSIFVLYPIDSLPFEHTTASGQYDFLGVTTSDSSFIPSWVYWNYSGYQNVDKTREKEYFALIAKMKTIGQNFGCGQALWQYEPELNDMGTPDALMLLPYWTNGCIGSEEGLYYESSASTPYHFLNAAEVSDQPSNPDRGLQYPSGPNVAEGVQHMQMMGDKYFMAETPDIEQAANADSNLSLIATVGPFPVTYTSSGGSASSQVQQRTWNIYEVQGSQLVEPLANQPVVLQHVQSRNPAVWLDAAQSWYLDPSRWSVYEAASGPSNWARVPAGSTSVPTKPEPVISVTHIVQGTQSISFDVDQTGVPVLIKESYFPNWQVQGAKGVYRVTPNLMVVIPTANHVTLSYGSTPVDNIGLIMTILGLGAVGFMWKAAPVFYPAAAARRRRRVLTWTLVDDDPEDGGPAGGGPAGGWGPDGKVSGRMAPTDTTDLDLIFKAYDIRGTVPDQMNADLARAVGAAFAVFTGAPRVLVARDMRPSGPELVAAFAEGANRAGVDVVDLGLCSTDEMYFASGSLDAPGAMFTASHNPAQYNGIKLCRTGARPIGADTGLQQVKATVAGILTGHHQAPVGDVPGTVTTADVLEDYAAKVRSFVDQSVLRPLRVVADTANGMGGLVVPVVFSALPFELEIMYGELDGTFPNHPADPIQPENLRDLQARILETGADVGLAFDGDADRCFMVDDRGEPLPGSTTTALVAAAMLEKRPGATILYNLICSKAVPEIIKERGGVPVRTRVGHSYIKAVMADTGALFGGEHSGHYYFQDNYRADSGAIAALVVLEVLSKSDRPLSVIRKDFERYAGSGEINTAVDDPGAVIERVSAAYSHAAQDRLDGLTVDLGEWWFNLRPSNTEPLLRLNLEAADRASCDAHTAEVLSLITAGMAGPERSER